MPDAPEEYSKRDPAPKPSSCLYDCGNNCGYCSAFPCDRPPTLTLYDITAVLADVDAEVKRVIVDYISERAGKAFYNINGTKWPLLFSIKSIALKCERDVRIKDIDMSKFMANVRPDTEEYHEIALIKDGLFHAVSELKVRLK